MTLNNNMETTMKKRYNILPCVLFALLLSIPVKQAMAQDADTLMVPWLDGNNLPSTRFIMRS